MGKPIATNKKAYHNFFLTDKWECGIALNGGEIKSIRAGYLSFVDSFVTIEEGQAFLHKVHIEPYKEASYQNEEPARIRKLLLHKKEIKKINSIVSEKGVTLIPTKMYFNRKGFLKVEIAVGRGKKLYDKRADIKKREVDRDLKRAIKSRG